MSNDMIPNQRNEQTKSIENQIDQIKTTTDLIEWDFTALNDLLQHFPLSSFLNDYRSPGGWIIYLIIFLFGPYLPRANSRHLAKWDVGVVFSYSANEMEIYSSGQNWIYFAPRLAGDSSPIAEYFDARWIPDGSRCSRVNPFVPEGEEQWIQMRITSEGHKFAQIKHFLSIKIVAIETVTFRVILWLPSVSNGRFVSAWPFSKYARN